MNEPPNPLHVPELLHNCIHPLRDSPSDLAACALVARSWVYPAQSHLFREVLRLTPHLIPYVRRLGIDILIHPDDVFSDVISLPFTHLVEISTIITLSNTSALAMQQLISLPTLSRVRITCYSAVSSAFQQIWDRSSPSIRSLHLDFQNHPETFEPVPHQCVAPINLEALYIWYMPDLVAGWLQHETCPFKFSNLKVLSVGQNLEILRWNSFASARQKIEALELEVSQDAEFIDLSLFPRLTFLRILATLRNSEASSKLIKIISTIPPSNNLREVVIYGVVEEESVCSELDSALIPLLLHPSATVELAWARLEPLFPQLGSRGMLRLTNWEEAWITKYEGMLVPSTRRAWAA
ncbi:hypothetical protein MVEN_01451200 [Mycena venus]|uniref:F-box domain-containing protein n=1 Tax=Mycena venus TaxID=2733690 RepID=A0A8H6XV46_9AGAR|nr:hypothetical protein MVEN_01451200 [Mycena venus]